MKGVKISEIRNLTVDELKTKLADERQELMNLRFQIETGQQTDTSRLAITRKLIAKYATVLHDAELKAEQAGAK